MSCPIGGVLFNMAYYPPNDSQNRIDAIKKKFEDAEKKQTVVKRTPAFRCDRVVCGKNVTHVSTKTKWNSDSEVKTVARKLSPKIGEIANNFQKSLSENNLDYTVRLISREKNILGESVPEYSVVNKTKKEDGLPDKVRLAMLSPLPAGPPPKKPPRIFTHTPRSEAKAKLEKIQNFMKSYEQKGHVIQPRNATERPDSDNRKTITTRDQPIYAQPVTSPETGTSFQTFGKTVNAKPTAIQPKTETPLHYMCTDLSQATTLEWCLAETLRIERPRTGVSTFTNPVSKFGSTPGIPIPPRVPSTTMMNQVFATSDADSLESDDASESEDTPKEHSASSPSLASDNESISQLTAKRKVYVKRVSSHLVNADKVQTRAMRLFESCLLIGLTLSEENGSKKNVPYVKSFFPNHVKPPPSIEFFCFPDADIFPKLSQQQQTYSIVLTNERGGRKFGYCRRVLPEGSHICLPLAYCIVSPHRAPGFFFTVLEELESRHGSPGLDAFMRQLYEHEFPNPGQSLKLTKILESVKRESPVGFNDDQSVSTLVRRPTDIRLENRDVAQLFHHLTIPVFIQIFSSMLLERKVLLLGQSLSILSCCIEALQSILYPFSWQHTLVPVLPPNLLEMCESPMPYIMGILKQSSVETDLISRSLTEVIVVDIDENRVVSSCKDESTILPSKLRKNLRSKLTAAVQSVDDERNIVVSEVVLQFFVDVCGHYVNHFVLQTDGTKVFQTDAFIRDVKSNSTRHFLEWFTETALFHGFIQSRDKYEVRDLFWKRSIQHFNEMEKNWKNRKTLGDRIKDLVHSK